MNNLSVLLADDDQVLRETVAELLGRKGFQVHAASTGEEALEIAGSESLDLGVFDLHMPGISGIELFSRLYEVHAIQLPTILMTSDRSHEVTVQVVEVGIYKLIQKPLRIDPLTQALQEMVEMFFGD